MDEYGKQKKIRSREYEGDAYAEEDEHRSGRPKKLSTKELTALRRDLLKGPRKGKSPVWTTKQVQELIRKKYHGNYVVRHVRRMLVDMGFSLQKPRPKHYKTDEKAQAHFKKTSGKSSENTEEEVSALFSKEVLNLKKEEVQQIVDIVKKYKK